MVIDDFVTEPDRLKPFVYQDTRTVSLHFDLSEVQSRMRLDDPFALELDYTRAMMGVLLFVPTPASILMIGLGGGSLAKYCHRYLPGARLTVVEINPHVIEMREAFHVPPDDERLRVVCGDGADFVARGEQRFDVLMVDGFNCDGQPDALCTPRFYDDCRALLAPDGVMVVNLHADGERDALLVDRIHGSFAGCVRTIRTADRSNRIVFAGRPCGPQRPARELKRHWDVLSPVHKRTLRGSFGRLMADRAKPAAEGVEISAE